MSTKNCLPRGFYFLPLNGAQRLHIHQGNRQSAWQTCFRNVARLSTCPGYSLLYLYLKEKVVLIAARLVLKMALARLIPYSLNVLFLLKYDASH